MVEKQRESGGAVYMTDQCPRCFSTKGFKRQDRIGTQQTIGGKTQEIVYKKKKVPVCLNCGKWSARKDIIKVFG